MSADDDNLWPHRFVNRHGEWWRARLTENGLGLEGGDIDGRKRVPLEKCRTLRLVLGELGIVFADEEVVWLRAVLMTRREFRDSDPWEGGNG